MVNATWVGSPNYEPGRRGQTIDHITLHIMAGYLAGTDATFLNPATKTSSTYGIGATGEIHQYVSESNTAWADADWLSNATGISIEHEGGLNSNRCTRACMDASARLCADIARRMGWPRLVHDGLNGNVYLHREIPGTDHTTCPDLAPNGLDYQYVINQANKILAGNGGGEETDVVTQNDINKIAEAVWQYKTHGTQARDRLTGIDNAANGANNQLRSIMGNLTKAITMLLRTDSNASGMLGIDGKPNRADLWTRIDWMDKRIRALIPNPGNKRPDKTAEMHLTDETIDRIADKVIAKLETRK